MNTKLINPIVVSIILFTSNQVFAQSKGELIGKCFAGAQFQVSMLKRNPSIIGGKVNKETIDTANRYYDRVQAIENRAYAQCKEITQECLRKTFKNNEDYEIAQNYYNLLGAYIQDKSTKTAELIIVAGNTSCYLLNQQK